MQKAKPSSNKSTFDGIHSYIHFCSNIMHVFIKLETTCRTKEMDIGRFSHNHREVPSPQMNKICKC